MDDPGAERDLFPKQPVGIAGSVEALVVMPDRRDGVGEEAEAVDNLRALCREQRGGDQEDAGGVVRLVAGRADDEQLGERDARSQDDECEPCLLYTSPSPRDRTRSRMPSSA